MGKGDLVTGMKNTSRHLVKREAVKTLKGYLDEHRSDTPRRNALLVADAKHLLKDDVIEITRAPGPQELIAAVEQWRENFSTKRGGVISL